LARITFITPAGQERVVNVEGGTLMTAATKNQVDGIEGACGGVCSCATCHVHVDAAWVEKVGPQNVAEQGMLEFDERATPTSRLGCQVKITPELDGLKVKVVGP
jgi:ferredoxin, 2Fe-2S